MIIVKMIIWGFVFEHEVLVLYISLPPPTKRFWYRWIVENLWLCIRAQLSHIAANWRTRCRSREYGKNWGFSLPQGDWINRSRRNLACKRRPPVCYSTPNLALIGQRGSIQEPPKMSKFVQNCGFCPLEADTMNTFRWNLAGKCRPWVCSNPPNLALIGKRGSVQERPKVSKLPKIVVIGHRELTQWTHSDEI